MRPTFCKPLPEGVIEVIGKVGRGWSLTELHDGTVMAVGNGYRLSKDGGVTWSDEKPLPNDLAGRSSAWDWGFGVIRLQSGALAVYTGGEMWISQDEGKTFGEGRPIQLLGKAYYASMVQLRSGRLLFPNRACFAGDHADVPKRGHTTFPEADIGSVSYSDDEGQSWQVCRGHLMGWFDAEGVVNGHGGVTAFDEPTLAETSDGRVLFFGRSSVGRIVYSYSEDGGETWSAVRPTELAASYSPARLTRIPDTGDLLCVWNQVSRAEIQRGFRRSRFSAAISQDSGRSWKNFRTLELSGGMEDVDRVPPEYPIQHVAGSWSDIDRIENFGIFRYMNVCFAKNKVYVLYVREWIEDDPDQRIFEDNAPTKKKGAEQVLRIYPIEYFYG